MCIIVAKEKKVKAPSIETLKTCFYNNPDGAGFMYVGNNEKVVIDKGYMTFKSFKKHYEKLLKKYHNFENKSLVIHFRIGTSGSNNQGNTHPFPSTSNIQDLKKTYFLTELGIAHNGIIHDYTISRNNANDISDTQNFVSSFIAPLQEHYKEFYTNEGLMDGIEKLISSKLCMLDTKDDLHYIGDFQEDSNGVKYSNGTYKNSWYSSYNYNNGYNYGYDTFKDYDNDISEDEDDLAYTIEEIYDDIDRTGIVEIPKNLYVSYESGNFEKVTDTLFYDIYEGTLYRESYDGTLIKKADDVYVCNEYGEEVF